MVALMAEEHCCRSHVPRCLDWRRQDALPLVAGLGLRGMSRREAREAVVSGRVVVEGQVCKVPSQLVPLSAHVWVEGWSGSEGSPDGGIVLPPPAPIRTYVLWKPRKVLCSMAAGPHDPEGCVLITDFFPSSAGVGTASCGRLDYESDGLILLTNDGSLNRALTDANGFKLHKTYRVLVEGKDDPTNAFTCAALCNGVEMGNGALFKAMRAVLLDREQIPTARLEPLVYRALLDVTLDGGKRRQLRRMLHNCGFKTLSLTRISMGPINLDMPETVAGVIRFVLHQHPAVQDVSMIDHVQVDASHLLSLSFELPPSGQIANLWPGCVRQLEDCELDALFAEAASHVEEHVT